MSTTRTPRPKLTTPPPPPPRKVASKPKPEPVPERSIQRQAAVAAAGEFAHASMRKPRASIKHVAHAHVWATHALSDEVMAILVANTDSNAICDAIAQLALNCAQQGFKLGVQHGAAS